MISRLITILALSACVSLTAGTLAHAQNRSSQTASEASAAAPWYERFTFGSQTSDTANSWVPRARNAPTDIRVSPQSRWGVSFGLQQDGAQAPAPAGTGRSGASAGAFYQVSPRVQVRGQVVVPPTAETESSRRQRAREPGLKLESAFRF